MKNNSLEVLLEQLKEENDNLEEVLNQYKIAIQKLQNEINILKENK